MSDTPNQTPGLVERQVYQSLVKRLAEGGDDPEASELRAALTGVGATVADLLADVEQKRQDRIEIESLRSEQVKDAEEQYIELVLVAADGFDLDVDSADAILSAARRTPENFLEDVRKLTGVRQKRELSEGMWQAKINEAYRDAQRRAV